MLKIVSIVIAVLSMSLGLYRWMNPPVQMTRSGASFNVDNIKIDVDTTVVGIMPIVQFKQESLSRSVESSKEILSMKGILSMILLLAALYVILSEKKYGEDTRKWAFSVVTLIAGVWIGSI